MLRINNIDHDPVFEKVYVLLRQKEKRTYSDFQVSVLPEIEPGHVHFKEWKIRKKSCDRLINYLKKKRKPLKILEIGCGNGWLSAKLAEIQQTEIIGLDPNKSEIHQAIAVFNKSNLKFIHDSFPTESLTGLKFDVILFSASVQYFASFAGVIIEALNHLTDRGEIHITDTHFYEPEELAEATNRSKMYFEGLGLAEMAHHYHHHAKSDFVVFSHRILANPKQPFNQIIRKINFYWIVIKND
ncbi:MULTISPECIES: class I SAM-dependent methyltransferase [Mucilaginibacter]|uniref:Methyltransferase domain-containing protein n=1 Tax=Mucilaginibacter rubeus TaxID=2027860 RepID=A0ABX7UCC7_9SPHI|nr:MULTISPECIES: methyltransferase domain-containing protein [Mucilaginibacter]QTE35441.1 methyltransferase domain-containing protein [Mucilaginibacter gossypii]QTE43811.1 methyltransferase domain-containing protein [Mucilaginibacter rubeus]QTE50411.1 methyltransferase domain-containing protein [Mucilaginibacter rubeus]QTE55497.1 methyltransferase domain-containing protein [Mucilaginibacter rubeus]QTE65041.1 methyltransferase domain-containing protein [Mucilaginibacter rubeus]